MKPKVDVDHLAEFVYRAIDNGDAEFLIQLLSQAHKDYIEVAYLCTDGNYTSQWTHKDVMSYFTTEGNI